MDLEKIGKLLKKEREEKQLSVADISESLCLRKSLIVAIESGNWALLPHEVYVKGYLKKYAHLLHVYDDILNELAIEEEAKVLAEKPVQQKIATKRTHSPTKVLSYSLVFALLVGFVILSQIYKEQPLATQMQNSTPASLNAAANNNSARQSLTEMQDVKKLMITCQERTWVSVVIDDAEKKEFMLNPHDIVVLNAKNRYDLLIGNAAGVKLILNGNDVQFSGQSGEVKRVKLS